MQASSELFFRLSSDFQINSDSTRYYPDLKKNILIFCTFQLLSKAVKKLISCALNFSQALLLVLLHSNSFDSVDEENSFSSQVDALL